MVQCAKIKRGATYMFCNKGSGFLGFALLFCGIGMLIATLLAWGWFMTLLAIAFVVVGTCLASW